MRNDPTVAVAPEPSQRPTALLHYSRDCELLGELPLGHLRHQIRGLHRLTVAERRVILLVLRELAEARRDLHASDLYRVVRAHDVSRGRRPLTEDEFWTRLLPALLVGVLAASWDPTWGLAA